MKTEIQKTELYQQFKKALGINDMRTDDNPYIVECCKIAEDYAKLRLSAVMVELPCDEEIEQQARKVNEGDIDYGYVFGAKWMRGLAKGN